MPPLVSIILPAFNEEKLLPGTLTSIKAAAQAAWGDSLSWEIIVCDNNSTDQTAAIAAAHGARVIFEPVNQIARARNTGASIAAGSWFVFIDADSQPSVALLTDVATAMKTGKVIGGGALLAMDVKARSYGFVLGVWNLTSRLFKLAAGSFIFCQADAFREIGGFPADLYAAEELEITRRLKAAGRKRRQKFIILTKHRLVTSSRKMHLYKTREIAGFFFRSVFCLGRNLRSRDNCAIWYDGRR